MTQNNIGALVVVKPGDQNLLAGIITERGMLVLPRLFLEVQGLNIVKE